MKNKALKIAMYAAGKKHRDVAKVLGINTKVFTNKLNRRTVNGYEARFTTSEKAMLASMFELLIIDIE